MIVKGKYTFPKQWPGVEFTNPDIEINPIIETADPSTMTIGVSLKMNISGSSGGFTPDINPVPVNDLNYDPSKPQELIDRVLARMEDFKVSV